MTGSADSNPTRLVAAKKCETGTGGCLDATIVEEKSNV